MKFLGLLFFTTLSLPLPAVACPNGMVFVGDGCSPPYEYTGWDLMRDRRAAIDAMGSNHRPSGPPLTAEQARKLNEDMKQLEKEKEEKRKVLAKGVWDVDSKSTPEGNLCAAVFSKYKLDEGGIVTIMGFQSPKSDAWLIFQGVGLPKSKNVTKMKVTLQQDNEPAQTLQVFNYRESKDVGTIMFAVPGLTAMLNGMSDTQRFRLSDNGKMLLDIQWTDAAPVIEKLKQCAK
ncbi:hypothetical protein [Methylotenera sp.]|uniref:hypothetical protein n=1 Tax=Methylotenera sp. TaxID=2051956 RepID=UPI002720960C|nr:hypothetical protein [Methylotenera sp.]MDO9205072.1 hypothetical protein [Methylotenera sp.]MDP2070026.1 hypothetical protein [Methylotenera sp.]MDP3005010.1 hypothetical protein [Methylotenera sp.]MDP3308978.1 hypothetical protein [Methylotenera sp.]